LIEYTDGYLVAPHTLEVFAVVEVKAMIRDRFSFSLPFEGALPGVDITHDPCNHFCSFLPQNFGITSPYRRIIVSQARDEIYITIAKYDQEYLDYLQGRFNPNGYVNLISRL
jgi:hypothetical protein